MLQLSFSRYRYRPQSPIDERDVFNVSIGSVDEHWLVKQLSELPEGWELALNSTVIDSRNRTFHIPMIDFVGGNCSVVFSAMYRDIVGRTVADHLEYFDSGRSFHAYAATLISKSDWLKFMGSLLLLNLPHAEAVIDSRWIGHRLRAGYSALRWSANSGHHLAAPTHVPANDLFARIRAAGY